ncbi:MAG: c-type cytochrome [Bdellovibrionota bacterium]
MRFFFVFAAIASLAACAAGDGTGGGITPLEPTFESIQANIFDFRCIECHRPAGEGPFSLLAEDSYESLVNVASTNLCVGDSDRVEPGDPDDSCIVKAIEGTVSPRMPLDGPPYLSDDEIQAIRDWIQGGAEPPDAP